MTKAIALNEPSLDTKGTRKTNGKDTTVTIPDFQPYSVEVAVSGVADILFHAYDPEDVERKEKAKKGSIDKKTDNVESYVHRNDAGEICIPSLNVKACLKDAAKRFKDPASPRKSARDLVSAGLVISPPLLSFGTTEWDAIDKRRVTIQKNAITRHRPMLTAGWKLSFSIDVLESELITAEFLRDLVDQAGRFNGLCDYRPDFGRFSVVSWDVLRAPVEVM